MPRGVRTDAENAASEVLRGQFNSMVAIVGALLGGATNVLLSDPGLAIGTSSKKAIRNTNPIHAIVGGEKIVLAAGETAFTATTHDIADPDADPREAIYVLSLAPGGSTLTITKGTTAAEDAAVAPSTPAGHLKVGEVLIQHDGSAVFDATTDDLDAAHLTVTYTDEDATALPEEVTVV